MKSGSVLQLVSLSYPEKTGVPEILFNGTGSIPGQRTALEIPSLDHKASQKSGIRHLAGSNALPSFPGYCAGKQKALPT
jgi:hypothetical protein